MDRINLVKRIIYKYLVFFKTSKTTKIKTAKIVSKNGKSIKSNRIKRGNDGKS